MKTKDVEDMLNSVPTPKPEEVMQSTELKIPFLSYKRSSKAGLWLLLLPFTVAAMILVKAELHVQSAYLDLVRKFFSAIDKNVVLTYLIPLVFLGLPVFAMIINLLAICHFQKNNKTKELIITIKYRPFNIIIFLLSFALVVFFLLPDKLSF
jgi:hypothetical protein